MVPTIFIPILSTKAIQINRFPNTSTMRDMSMTGEFIELYSFFLHSKAIARTMKMPGMANLVGVSTFLFCFCVFLVQLFNLLKSWVSPTTTNTYVE